MKDEKTGIPVTLETNELAKRLKFRLRKKTRGQVVAVALEVLDKKCTTKKKLSDL